MRTLCGTAGREALFLQKQARGPAFW